MSVAVHLSDDATAEDLNGKIASPNQQADREREFEARRYGTDCRKSSSAGDGAKKWKWRVLIIGVKRKACANSRSVETRPEAAEWRQEIGEEKNNGKS